MLKKIIEILNKQGIENWRITEGKSSTCELYFIKKKLDIPRYKDINQYSVTVFHDFEKAGKKFRGDSSAVITPGMTDEEINEKLKGAYFGAGFVTNPYYELADPVKADPVKSNSNILSMDLKDAALKMAEAIFSVDKDSDAFLNSVEIFASKRYIRILTSNGMDVSFESAGISGEFVTQCTTPVDVEQFRQFAYENLETEAVKEKIAQAIEDVRARARAKNMPKSGTYSIILSQENLATLFEYYEARSSAGVIVPGYCDWKVGDKVQGDNIECEKLNLVFEPVDPYSGEGIPMIKRDLLKDGELKVIHGATRFSRYLGIEPTGNYERIVCKNGSVKVSDMRKEGVLEPISFSDFQMDFFDGHFKGEIRLAYLYHADGTREELTGGSVNGCLPDVQGKLRFSTEHYESLAYSGPLAILIPNVSVAGE